MIAYPANKNNASYDIPAGVSSIEDNAFTGCTNLESITIPNSVTTIGRFAFYTCTKLESIIIPNSVTTIGSYAFSDCSSLTSIFLPGSLGASIPDTTTSINYTINDEKVTIISIVLGEGQTSFDIPDTICGVSVAAVAADHQSKVGNHTHNWDSKDTCLLCGTVQLENVSIAITEPKATEALAEESSVSTEGVAADPIIWQPSHTNAGYNKVYTARVTLSANTGYMYADSVTVKVNNSDVNSSNITKNEDGTITVTYQFAATDKRTLTASDFTFTAPADLVYNGNAKAATVTAKPSGVGNITVKYYDKSVKIKGQASETNATGKKVEVTTTTKTDADGNVTGVTEKSVIDHIAKNTTAAVTVKTDGDGNVTSAKANITKTSDSSKVSLSGKVIGQITEAAGADTKVRVTMTVKDSEGNTKYKVQANADEIVPGETLYIYKLNTKTGKYTMVNDKEYKVTKAGTVTVNMSRKATYELVTAQDSKAIEKAILATVKPANTVKSLSADKTTTFKLSKQMDMDNVKSITYATSRKSIATVSKKGTITAVNAGTATVKATITLKNGTKKTIKVK